jgi:hypothetical protein
MPFRHGGPFLAVQVQLAGDRAFRTVEHGLAGDFIVGVAFELPQGDAAEFRRQCIEPAPQLLGKYRRIHGRRPAGLHVRQAPFC